MKIKIIVVLLVLLLLLVLLIPKAKEPLILDDVTPAKSCDKLIEKAEIVYVVPLYKDGLLTDYPEWCAERRSEDKTFGLHGISHQYYEFLEEIEEVELEEAVKVFEECFGYPPELFRPPYNKISMENRELVKKFNLTIYQDTYPVHPYCHCQPSLLMKPLNWLAGC